MFTDVMDKQCGQPIGYSPKVASCNTEAYESFVKDQYENKSELEKILHGKIKDLEKYREYYFNSISESAKKLNKATEAINILKDSSSYNFEKILAVLKAFEL